MQRIADKPLELKKGPRGSKPGEKRGGRAPGYATRAAEERDWRITQAMKLATEQLGDETIAAMTPKDVMVFTMHLMAKAGWWLKAAEIAEKVAKYIHPALSSMDMNANVRRSTTDFTDEELVTLAAGSYTDVTNQDEPPEQELLTDDTVDDTALQPFGTVTSVDNVDACSAPAPVNAAAQPGAPRAGITGE